MIVSVIADSLSTSTLQPLHETALEFHRGCTDFEQALDMLFQDVDQMRRELVDRMQVTERERNELRLREAELSKRHQDSHDDVQRWKEELESRDLQLAKALDDLQAAREELNRERERESVETVDKVAQWSEQLQRLQESLDSMRRETAALQSERDAWQARATRHEEQLARARHLEEELAQTRAQLERTQQQLCQADGAVRDHEHDQHDASALATLTQEREALEAELELVRSRAVELNETVTQQQHEIAAQKTELGTELQQLRKLVEKQADLISDRGVLPSHEMAQPLASPTVVLTQPSDPVVNSVMAQFAKLQKDVAQRRRRKQ
ncbi:MAG: hypothetical protein ACYC0X_25200 [Pirellulaceae bacterium]